MKLSDIISRTKEPVPWGEADNIPWNEPGFSRRMLREHLSQEHDLASRRFETIDLQVEWIHDKLLAGKPGRILDLGCGPGFYSNRLAVMGHDCTGIDFSPASIEHAKKQAASENLQTKYYHEDIRDADFGSGYDLVMLIYGEFNVFKRSDARSILQKANLALKKGGLLILESHTLTAIRKIGELPPSWNSSKGGLFSDDPHILFQEYFWMPDKNIAMTRYFVIDAEKGDVSRYAQTFQGYSDDDYRDILDECGFGEIEIYDTFGDSEKAGRGDLFIMVAVVKEES